MTRCTAHSGLLKACMQRGCESCCQSPPQVPPRELTIHAYKHASTARPFEPLPLRHCLTFVDQGITDMAPVTEGAAASTTLTQAQNGKGVTCSDHLVDPNARSDCRSQGGIRNSRSPSTATRRAEDSLRAITDTGTLPAA